MTYGMMDRIRKGFLIGAAIGLVVSSWAVVIAVAQWTPAPVIRGAAAPLWLIVLTNVGGCATAGALLGVLTPIARSAAGSFVCSFIATLPLASSMVWVFRQDLDPVGIAIAVAIVALVLAIPASTTLHSALRD